MKKQTILIALTLVSIGFMACGSASKTDSVESESSVEAIETKVEFKNIQSDEFKSMMNDSNTVVIDVRTADEVQQGFITGADLFIDINSSDFNAKINELDKDKTYLMYCRSGGRSSRASEYMINNGFTSVYNLNGGITNFNGDISTP